MIDMKYETNFHPTSKHLSQIKKWLRNEQNQTNKGFFRHWDRIAQSFDKNELVILTENNCAIGFLLYDIIEEIIISIDIMEIEQKYRYKGLGRKLVVETLVNFRKRGNLICKLFCSPEDSEHFWKKLGFVTFPDFPGDNRISMYKPLIKTLEISEKNIGLDRIELWNVDPAFAKKTKPKWTWNIKFQEDSRELLYPIIHPAYGDWQLSWKNGKETKFENRVKRYNIAHILFDNFILIRNLEE